MSATLRQQVHNGQFLEDFKVKIKFYSGGSKTGSIKDEGGQKIDKLKDLAKDTKSQFNGDC